MVPSPRREQLVRGAVDYVLDHSLSGLSLRPLAAALDTSDRMLVYHFGSRDALVRAVIGALGAELRTLLVAALPDGTVPPGSVVLATAELAEAPEAEAILRVWLEMCGLAARGEQPYAEEARQVIDSWVAWLATRLPGPDPATAARAVLAAVEGLLLLRLATGQDISQAARHLAELW